MKYLWFKDKQIPRKLGEKYRQMNRWEAEEGMMSEVGWGYYRMQSVIVFSENL